MIHGGKGYGTRNEEGERMLEMVESLELFFVNTGFQKREEHLVTYKSGVGRTQIDYFLVRSKDRKQVKDAKVIPGKQ